MKNRFQLNAFSINYLHSLKVDIFPLLAFGYLVLLTIAELLTTAFAPRGDQLVFSLLQIQYVVLLFVLCLHTAVEWETPNGRLLMTLTITPMVRLISLSLPLASFPIVYWFIFTSVPLFVAAVIIMHQLNIPYIRAKLSLKHVLGQIAIGLTGILIGYGEYLILKPEPFIAEFDWRLIIFPALVLLICTGYMEELVFRRMMQQVAVERLGYWRGIVYVAAIFAVLHIGYNSFADVIFVFIAGLAFGWFAEKTGSIVGVTFAHGLANIFLFLIMPFSGVEGPTFVIAPDLLLLLEESLLWLVLIIGSFGLMAMLMHSLSPGRMADRQPIQL